MSDKGSRAGAEAQVIEAIQQGRRFLVTAHPDPDGDAIGCMAAARTMLRELGREVVAFNPDPVPRRFRFLDGTDQFVQQLDAGEVFDTTLVMDCSPDRILDHTGLGAESLGKVVVVDHHKIHGSGGDVVYRDPDAASVGVLLFRVFQRMDLDLGPVAEPLFCTVMSDTGSFRYQNTDPESMRVSAGLLEHGVDTWRVASHLYEDHPAPEVKLLGLVLGTLEVSDDGLCAALLVTPQMLEETGCGQDVVDGMINYARGVEGAQVAILMRPGDQRVRVSLRSRGAVDVSAVAKQFGGGGHHNAAGFSRTEDLAVVRAELFEAVTKLLAEAKKP